jgi:hypothetical protein
MRGREGANLQQGGFPWWRFDNHLTSYKRRLERCRYASPTFVAVIVTHAYRGAGANAGEPRTSGTGQGLVSSALEVFNSSL